MFKEYRWGKSKIIETKVPNPEDWMPELLQNFDQNQDKCVYSHKINGRWENSYLPIDLVPQARIPIRYARDIGVEKFTRSLCMIYNSLDQNESSTLPFWFNSSMPGESTGLHDHAHLAALSGVLYLSCQSKSGNLYFHLDGLPELEIMPEIGKLVLFEPWMRHGVRANRSSQPRVSLAFNLQPFPLPSVGL
jgi:hypothetical protein